MLQVPYFENATNPGCILRVSPVKGKGGLYLVEIEIVTTLLLRPGALLFTVNGQWGAWEEWSSCTESCNGGVQMRIRKCNNPSPANGGRDCRGLKEQTQRCNIQACPGE